MSHETPVVFVVDDDVSVRESLELLIRSAGWQPETFESAQEFLARPRAPVPNCLILDVNLPDLNGLDLQKFVSVERADMPIIFVTGYGDVADDRHGDEGRRRLVLHEAVQRQESVGRRRAGARSQQDRCSLSTRRCVCCATVTPPSAAASRKSWRWWSPAC